MGRPTVLLGLLFISVALFIAAWPAISREFGPYIDRALLPYKIMKLTSEEADTALRIPVAGVRVRDVADTWDEARGSDRSHQGQDIFAPQGTPVLSATDGYVVRVGENTLGGNVVVVVGRGGRALYYAHLDSYGPDAVIGTLVTATSTLGYVGTTGNATGTPPHLHFGVYTREGAIDPLPLLIDR